MGDKSKIEWTDATWNPVVGCTIVSPGCTNCYAMAMAGRLQKINRTGGSGSAYINHYDGTTQKTAKGKHVWTGKVALVPEHILTAPLRWKKPRRIFVNSMGDLFHEAVPDEWIDKVFAVMALCPQHTFQVLSKRSARMRAYCSSPKLATRLVWPLPNVWLGVSAEDQQRADERIPDLLATPAAVRWVSAEPLLGPIDFTNIRPAERYEVNALTGFDFDAGGVRNHLDWIVAGGESGPGARPLHPEWARSIRDQCKAAGVAFLFKQWGAHAPWDGDNWEIPDGWDDADAHDRTFTSHGVEFLRVGKKRAGRLLDGVLHDEYPRVMT